MFLWEDASTSEQPSQCQSKYFNVYANQSRSHQPFSLFATLNWKGGVTQDKKILLSSQNVPNNWFLNIYSKQISTYLDSGQICKIMQIQILASTFIIPGFGTFRVEFTFCVERLKGKDKIPGGCKFLYHPNVRNSCSHIPNLPLQCGV